MTLSTLAWVSVLVSLFLLPSVAATILIGSLRIEERKLALPREQDDVNSCSSRALSDLREWIHVNPDDPYSPIARHRYSECVWSLRAIDEPHYDWSGEQIAQLELVDE